MANASTNIRRARPLLGTFVEIEAEGTSEASVTAAIEAAFDAVATVHRLMSFHEVDSDVSRLNRQAFREATRVHPWTFRVLQTAVELHRRSNGIFDVAVAPALQQMGLLPAMTGDVHIVDGAPAFDAIELLGGHAIRFRRGIAIDLGGIAKGFAVDRALDALRAFDIHRGLVNAGGDLAAFGAVPPRIEIRHPRKPSELICSIEIADAALATTARRFDPFAAQTASTAVIDPATGRPPELIDGVTVRAPSCMIADALTKIVMIAGEDASELLERADASALVVSADGYLQVTSDWHHAVHRAA